eukprot:superscaffoldBa00000163_g2321
MKTSCQELKNWQKMFYCSNLEQVIVFFTMSPAATDCCMRAQSNIWTEQDCTQDPDLWLRGGGKVFADFK